MIPSSTTSSLIPSKFPRLSAPSSPLPTSFCLMHLSFWMRSSAMVSRYPLPPTGDLHSYQHVKQILLPASHFISIPNLEENEENNNNDHRAPVRLDDSSRAHKMLLEA